MTLLISPEHTLNNPVDSLLVFDQPHTHHKQDKHQIIRNSVEQLPDMQKKVISFIDIFGFNYAECCQALNINETQLKAYLKKARQSLLKQLETVL